ncbi:hypothetical protein [Nocardiopsis potens]|uniref:hypothetical protein n=1 Tax=Nocardiopsis potens TaxID=1246458 RepID=UPI000476ED0B|nr:hypothetical protein [Nocardiopsis potens]
MTTDIDTTTDDVPGGVAERPPGPAETQAPPAGGAAAADGAPAVPAPREGDDGGPPPLPPLLEIGASTATTIGAGAWAVGGPLGLAAAGALGAGAAAAAYARRRRAAQRREMIRKGGAATRTAGGAAAGGGRRGLLGRLGAGGKSAAGRPGAGRAAAGMGRKGAGPGAAGRGAGAASGKGAFGRGAKGSGPGGAARSGRGPGSGSRRFGGGGAGSAGPRRSGAGAPRRRGGPSASTGWGGLPPRSGGSGRFGGGGRPGGGAGARSAPRAGTGSGGGRGRHARPSTGAPGLGGRGVRGLLGRTRPAGGTGSGRGRTPGLPTIPKPRLPKAGGFRPRVRVPRLPRAAGRAARRAWESHPVRRTRSGVRRAWRATRPQRVRVASYMRRRVWAMQARAVGYRVRSWAGRVVGGLWERMTRRVRSEPRYGSMRGAQLALAAAAIAGFGARRRHAEPRTLTGRVIGTSAPSPQGGPIAAIGRGLLSITIGSTEEKPVSTQVQRIRDAAEELRQAIGEFSGMGMREYEEGLGEISGVLSELSRGVAQMAQVNEEEMPVDKAVLDYLGTIAEAAQGAADVAEELPGLYRAAHERELERLESPRAGEEKWDVTQQDD